MCNYAAKVQGGGNALCNLPGNSHSWQGTGYNPGFICGANAKPCTSTQVANSDKSKKGSIAVCERCLPLLIFAQNSM